MLRLRQIRKQKKQKQCDLAKRVGVSSTLLCLLEHGKYSPRPELLLKIGRILKCEPSILLEKFDEFADDE